MNVTSYLTIQEQQIWMYRWMYTVHNYFGNETRSGVLGRALTVQEHTRTDSLRGEHIPMHTQMYLRTRTQTHASAHARARQEIGR